MWFEMSAVGQRSNVLTSQQGPGSSVLSEEEALPCLQESSRLGPQGMLSVPSGEELLPLARLQESSQEGPEGMLRWSGDP